MHQRSFASGSRQAPDPYDQFLEQHGFYRKHTARDSSCLFRVISEQMFDTQLHHLKVRASCVKFMRKHHFLFQSLVDRDFEEYLDDLSKPKTFGSLIELQALGLLYRRNIILFDPFTLGNAFGQNRESFTDVFRVFYSPDNHFDSVFTSDYIEDAAMCQSICYEIIYKDLFKLPDVFFAVDQMLHDLNCQDQQKSSTLYCVESKDGYCTRVQLSDGRSFELDLPSETNCILENSNQCRFHAEKDAVKNEKCEQNCLVKKVEKDILLPNKYVSCVRQLLQEGITPFPYKVAKALDPTMYRNIEFDSWNEHRKEMRLQNWYYGGSDFKVGAKCYVKLRNTEYNDPFVCHIQEISYDKSQCLVFIEKLGEKHWVPYTALSPLPPEQFQPWTLPFRMQKGSYRGNSRHHNYGIFRHYNSYRYKHRGTHYFSHHDDAYFLEKSMSYAQRHAFAPTAFGSCGSNYISTSMCPNINCSLPDAIESTKLYDSSYCFNPYGQQSTSSLYNKLTDLSHFVPPMIEYCTMPLTVEHALADKLEERQQPLAGNALQSNAKDIEQNAIVDNKRNDDSNAETLTTLEALKNVENTNAEHHYAENCQENMQMISTGMRTDNPTQNAFYMSPAPISNSYGEYPPNVYAMPQVLTLPEDTFQYGYDGYACQQPTTAPATAPVYYMYSNGVMSGYNPASVPMPSNMYMQSAAPMGMAPTMMPQLPMPPMVAGPPPISQQGGYYFPNAPPTVCSTYSSVQAQLNYQPPLLCDELPPNDSDADCTELNTPLKNRVNFEAKKSLKHSYNDLPDLYTLRYFYNLGIQFYHNSKNKTKTDDIADILDLQFLDVKENLQDNETQTCEDDHNTMNPQSDANNNVTISKDKPEYNTESNTPNHIQNNGKNVHPRRQNNYRGGYNNRMERNSQNYGRSYNNMNNNSSHSNSDYSNMWNKKQQQQGGGSTSGFTSNSRSDWHNQRNSGMFYQKAQRNDDYDKKRNTSGLLNRKKTTSVSSSNAATPSVASKDADDFGSRHSPNSATTPSAGDGNNCGSIKPPLTSPALQSGVNSMMNQNAGQQQQLTPQNLNFGINFPPPTLMSPMGGGPHVPPIQNSIQPPPFLTMPPPNILSTDMNNGSPNINLNGMSNSGGFTEPFNRRHMSSVSSSDNGENNFMGFMPQQHSVPTNYSGVRMSLYCMPPPPNSAGANMMIQHPPPQGGYQGYWNAPPPPPSQQQPHVGQHQPLAPVSWHNPLTPQKANMMEQNNVVAAAENMSNKKINHNNNEKK